MPCPYKALFFGTTDPPPTERVCRIFGRSEGDLNIVRSFDAADAASQDDRRNSMSDA